MAGLKRVHQGAGASAHQNGTRAFGYGFVGAESPLLPLKEKTLKFFQLSNGQVRALGAELQNT